MGVKPSIEKVAYNDYGVWRLATILNYNDDQVLIQNEKGYTIIISCYRLRPRSWADGHKPRVRLC